MSKPVSARLNPVTLVALVVGAFLLALVAVITVGGGDDDSGTAGVGETRPVVTEGAALEPFADGADPAVGTIAPALEGQSFDGAPITIGRSDRPSVVAFMAHWCPHCQREIPLLVDWLEENGTPSDIDLFGVSTGTSADQPNYPPSAWLEREGWTVETIADDAEGTAAAAFGLSSYPYFVAIDADGRVAARASGELSTAQWEQLLDAARG